MLHGLVSEQKGASEWGNMLVPSSRVFHLAWADLSHWLLKLNYFMFRDLIGGGDILVHATNLTYV